MKAAKGDKVLVDGTWRPATNSLGKLIHPTLEGIENFWRWFGDSKVVDAGGRPLVVYHGTREDFNAFDPEVDPINPTDWGQGSYFAKEADYANLYAEGEGSRVLPVYLKIARPAKNRTMMSKAVRRTLDGDEYWDTVEEVLADKGFDGVEFTHRKPEGRRTEFVVFSPTQIKSATGNRGAFDPADPAITNPRRKAAR